MNRAAAVVVGRRWLDRSSELTFAVRSVAGAASRAGPVPVLVPGTLGWHAADGAFDLDALGPPGALVWPAAVPTDTTVIVDELTPDIGALLTRVDPASVLFLATAAETPRPAWHHLRLVGGSDPVGVHVPVNRLAERHRHHGFGFTGYLLVLSDGTGEPPPAVAWVSAAFDDADVVVVEDAVASAWKGRALRGRVAVDTRMDLWRLLAHASVCIDLAPGAYIARECIEALRFGTPIIVPDGSGPAEVHARAGGGMLYGDPHELLSAVASLQDESLRSAASLSGRRYADDHFGDPAALVRQVGRFVSST